MGEVRHAEERKSNRVRGLPNAMKTLRILSSVSGARECAIVRLQRAVGTNLPRDYLDFVRQNNGGILSEENDTFTTLSGEQFVIAELFPVDSEHAGVLHEWQEFRGRVPDALLPIGADNFGNLFCLGISGESYDQVLFWDHESERAAFELVGVPMPGETSQQHSVSSSAVFRDNVKKVAGTFADFVDGLTQYSDDSTDQSH